VFGQRAHSLLNIWIGLQVCWLCYIIFNLYKNNLTFDVGIKMPKFIFISPACINLQCRVKIFQIVNIKHVQYRTYILQYLIVSIVYFYCSTTGITWIQWLAINTNMAKELRCPTPFSSQCFGYGLQVCWFCQIIFNLCENNLTFESGLTLACPGEENRYFLFPQDLPEKMTFPLWFFNKYWRMEDENLNEIKLQDPTFK
jgi:hypothetical protein